MASGLFSNSKATLIFAGGVIGAAALFAGYLAPPSPVGSADESAAPDEEQVAQAEVKSTWRTTDDPGFSEFAGFADDAELIDETDGFDPTPDLDSAVVIPDQSAPGSGYFGTRDADPQDGNTQDGDGPPEPDEPRKQRQKAARTSPNAAQRQANLRPQDLSVAQMKAILAKPPRVSSADE